MTLYCTKHECQKNAIVCLYLCPMSTKRKCSDYLKNIDQILAVKISDELKAKYGDPVLFDPRLIRKRTVIKLEDKPQPKPKPQRKKTVKEPEAKPKVTSGKIKAEAKTNPDAKPKVATKKTTKKAKPSSSPKPSVTEGKRRVRGKAEPEKKRRKR